MSIESHLLNIYLLLINNIYYKQFKFILNERDKI